MEIALGDSAEALRVFFQVCIVKGVAVECLVGHNVVGEQSFEVFLSVLAEQEGIDPGAELQEGEVVRGEESATNMI